MKSKREIITIGLLTLPLCLLSGHYPQLQFAYLAPLVVSTYYRFALGTSLWASLGCGLLLDLLASGGRLGPMALSYCLTTLAIYRCKSLLFVDLLSTIPLLTALFSALSTIFFWITCYALGSALPPFSTHWLITDLLFFPLLDGLYALVVIQFPLYLIFGRKRPPAPYRMPRPE